MTKQDFKLAEDLLAQISKIEEIKNRIQVQYDETKDDNLKGLLGQCNNVCSALKEIKEKQFENL